MKRSVINIDDEKCNGCGLCIPNCPEGAIQIIDGKARLVSDLFCDGLGACIGHCPEGAITVEEREAGPYDECSVMENVVKGGARVTKAHLKHLKDHGEHEYLRQALVYLREKGIDIPGMKEAAPRAEAFGGCPGARTMDFRKSAGSALRQWPVQLQLVNVNASYFQDADLVIAADCVPFAQADFHERFLRHRALIIFCPKLDRMPEAYIEKLADILRSNRVKSVTVVHMEVPCCFGLRKLVEEALRRSGKNIEFKDYTISIKGEPV
jgi:NAD-dependent dihydropyrimidine dehydrogenase PreA subunit